MIFFDAHLHCVEREAGGFLVGLEGAPAPGTLSNAEALRRHDPASNYVSFYYVSSGETTTRIAHSFLKYHPRREKYDPERVIASIRLNQPRCVMLDTLNEPYWQAYDYWEIARAFPEIPFVFAHAGGYLVNDFIKICHFQKNVWIDFALTHTMLDCYGRRPEGLPYIGEAIAYALHSPFAGKVLLASDAPFFSQAEVVDYYAAMGAVEALNANFSTLLSKITGA